MHYGHDDGGDGDVVVDNDDDDDAGDDGNQISFNLFFHCAIIRCQLVMMTWKSTSP